MGRVSPDFTQTDLDKELIWLDKIWEALKLTAEQEANLAKILANRHGMSVGDLIQYVRDGRRQ